MPPPSKRPTDCCDGLRKIAKEEMFKSCYMKCGKDHCCGAECFGTAFGFLKNGKFDKDTTISAVSSAFTGDQEWITVRNKFI